MRRLDILMIVMVVLSLAFSPIGSTSKAAPTATAVTASAAASSIHPCDMVQNVRECRREDWVLHVREYLMDGAYTYIKQGQRIADGSCAFETVLELEPNENAVAEQDLGYNFVTCEAWVEQGTPPPDAVAEWTADSDPMRPADEYRSGGYFKTWWKDPVKLQLNSVTNWTYWHWDGSCVRTPVQRWPSYRHASWSGWSRRADNWNAFLGCASTGNNSYAHYLNSQFCHGADTETFYDRNRHWGNKYGKMGGGVITWARGACLSLIKSDRALIRTL